MPLLINDLDERNPLRNQPLSEAWQRRSIPWPFDISDSLEKIDAAKAKAAAGERKFLPWKQVQPTWPIAKKTYNQLGTVWTDHTEWTFESPK